MAWSGRTRVLAAVISAALVATLALPVGAGGVDRPMKTGSTDPLASVPDGAQLWRDEGAGSTDVQRAAVGSMADDAFPGEDLYERSDPAFPAVVDTLDAAGDDTDIFWFYAAPGEDIMLMADPDATLDIDIALYRDDVGTPTEDVSSLTNGSPGVDSIRWLDYTVPGYRSPGVWYVVVEADAGAGGYELWWSINSRSDGNIPGVPVADSPHEDSVDTVTDSGDTFAIHLGAGQSVEITVTPDDAGKTASVALCPPDTEDTWGASPVDWHQGTPASVNYTVPPTEEGVYYIDVWADSEQNMAYTLEWSVTSATNIPGNLLPASPVGGTMPIAGSRVYYVDLTAGQQIDLSVAVGMGAGSVNVFGPDAIDVNTDTPLESGSAASYTVGAEETGRYYIQISTGMPGVAYLLTYSVTDAVERVSGTDRYETSAAISEYDFPHGTDVVVVATGRNFADALSASGLAGGYDAPVLLVGTNSLPAPISAEIQRLGATRCFIIGGESAVGSAVASEIDALPGMNTPVRISGPDRYATAAAVAEQALWRQGYRLTEVCLLARGDDFADALALSPASWAYGMPILLTKPTSLSSATSSFLTEMPVSTVGIAGGEAAISADVEAAVAGIVGGGNPTQRLAQGTNRYETAAMLAEWASLSSRLDWGYVGLATGTNFPDALSGGPGIAKRGGVLMLTKPGYLHAEPAYELTFYEYEIDTVELLGGTGALSDDVKTAVEAIVQ